MRPVIIFSLILIWAFSTFADQHADMPKNVFLSITNKTDSPQTSSTKSNSLSPSHLGFFEPSSTLIPDSIREASKSVVLIAVPYGEKVSVKDLFKGKSVQEAITFVENLPLQQASNKADKDIFLYMLRQCSNKSNDECLIYNGDMFSSGYVVDDGSKIRTAFHEIRHLVNGNSLKTQNPNDSTLSIEIPVFVYDSNFNLIASPNEGSLSTAKFPKQNLSAYNPKGVTLPNDDLAELRFNKHLAQPLKNATIAGKIGDSIFIAGYPLKTEDRKAFGLPDSPGMTLRISTGKILTLDDAYRKMGTSPETIPEYIKQHYRNGMITFDADGAPGLSGGATLNANGEVIGTYTAGYPADGTASLNHIGYGSNEFSSQPAN